LVAPILAGWGAIVESLEIVAGTGGIFDIHVDGELVFFKKMIGRYPDPDDVLPLLRDRIGPEMMPSG
jgi:selenoprotein W-related protein